MVASAVIGCEDRVRDEAPAVWEQGGWAVQGRQPSGTQGRQIRRTETTRRDATLYKTRIKTFSLQTDKHLIVRSPLLCNAHQTPPAAACHDWQLTRPALKIAPSILETLCALTMR